MGETRKQIQQILSSAATVTEIKELDESRLGKPCPVG